MDSDQETMRVRFKTQPSGVRPRRRDAHVGIGSVVGASLIDGRCPLWVKSGLSSAPFQAACGALLKKPLQAAWRSLQLSAIPILTNSSRQQLLILKDPTREGRAFLQCANALPRRR